MVKFLRRTWSRYSKLGKRRKKKQVWRKPTGRHNKMREQTKGSAAIVSIGYRSNKKSRDKLMNKKPVKINNLKDLEKIKEDEIAIIGSLGKRKKIEIAKRAKEMKIEIYNMDPEKFLRLNMKKVSETKAQSKEVKIKNDQKTAPKGFPLERNFFSSSSVKSRTEDKKWILEAKKN